MNEENNKKNPSSGFVWFIIGAFILALLTIQNLIDTKFAKVSFSYQLEHLVNLDLIQPEESRKTAFNDNLVTFTGRFRDRKTEESKKRYKFLELQNRHNQLLAEKDSLAGELMELKERILDAANVYVQLKGEPLPYVVVDDSYAFDGDEEYSVVLKTMKKKDFPTVPTLITSFQTLNTPATAESVDAFGKELLGEVRIFRSPTFGIGNESLKLKLKGVEGDLLASNERSISEKMALYQRVLGELDGMLKEIGKEDGSFHLLALRSVRSYKDAIDEKVQLTTKIEDNDAQLEKARNAVASVIWFFNNQELSTKSLEKQDPEQFNHWFLNAKEEWDNFAQNSGGVFKAPNQPLNTVLEKTFKSEEPTPNYFSYFLTILPVLLIILVLYFVFSRQMKGMGTSAMNFGKSPAKLLAKGSHKITFKDVAGVDEAIEELQEIVEFLRNPQKFTALGGKIPKGVLCIGPPGTGKTLIAKAVAGEADRPFFTISGSDFVEMFVGVGASRIRDMFDQAKKNAPCIIFMDEIDAVGRHRGAGIGGGHDEREQTLNQLLVEMDGFDTNDGVILMAATNRPDVLDKALLRPGRFDRRIVIGLPDIKGRYEILKVHARKIKMDPSVDLLSIARSTPGASGADLMNLLNEAALLAARRNRTAVTASDASEARDKVLFGKERRSLELDENEKRTTAYHESGHAIVGLVVEHADPVEKVTIIPRGMSLGSTMFLPKKNRVSYWKNELKDQLAVLMGGRVAEEIFVGDVSSGARQDIEQATNLARSMVCEWGMSDKLGVMAYDERSDGGQYLGMAGHHEKKYSEETARIIDAEVKSILDEAYARAISIVQEKRASLELMAQMLIRFETLDAEDVRLIIEGNWDSDKKQERLKIAEELHKKVVGTSPPSEEGRTDRNNISPRANPATTT